MTGWSQVDMDVNKLPLWLKSDSPSDFKIWQSRSGSCVTSDEWGVCNVGVFCNCWMMWLCTLPWVYFLTATGDHNCSGGTKQNKSSHEPVCITALRGTVCVCVCVCVCVRVKQNVLFSHNSLGGNTEDFNHEVRRAVDTSDTNNTNSSNTDAGSNSVRILCYWT